MPKRNRDSFEKIAEQYDLRKFGNAKYILLACNLMFEFNEQQGYAYARGVIPIDLAVEMYESQKENEEKTFSNNSEVKLVNPLEFAHYPGMDINKLLEISKQIGKEMQELWKEERKQALLTNYDNCYIDFSYIYTPKSFAWYLETVEEYYKRKRENQISR